MLINRKVTFYLFVCVYLIFCPLIILRSLGIVFKSDSVDMEKTGIIYLSSIPSGAAVEINTELFPEKTPTIIRRLSPGNYDISVSMDHYKTWGKTLSVEKQKITSAEDILLFPQNWTEETIPLSFEKLTAVADEPFFIIYKGPLFRDVFIYQGKKNLGERILNDNPLLTENKLSPLIKPDDLDAQAEVARSYSVEGSSQIIFQLKRGNKQKFLWFDFKGEKILERDITTLVIREPEQFLWDKNVPHDLYFLHNHSLSRINLKNSMVRPDFIRDVKNFAVDGQRIFVLTLDNRLMRYDHDGTMPESLADNPEFNQQLFPSGEEIKIIPLSADLLIFLSPQGSLLSNKPPHLLIEKSIKGVSYDPDKKRLLCWKEDDIGYFDFREQPEETSLKHDPLLTWLNLRTPNIQQASWANQGNHIIFSTAKNIFITETQSFGQPVIDVMAAIKPKSSFAYDKETGTLFFLTAKGQLLGGIQMIPRPSATTTQGSREETRPGPSENLSK